MTKEQLNFVAQSHFYWFHEAASALNRMNAVAFDMTEQGSKAFAEAREQFALARSRCEKEWAVLEREQEKEGNGPETPTPFS
jgi:hypothetical protein